MARQQPPISQLRPVLELALELARSAAPNRPMPGPVRGLVRGRRLPASWEATMRRALEEDDSFRSWVAAAIDEAQAGRLAWLWITRPDGWSAELSGLVEQEEVDHELHVLADRVAALESELVSAAQARADLEQTSSQLRSELEERALDLARAESARAAAERRADEASAASVGRPDRAATLERDLAAAGERTRQLESELARLQGKLAEAEGAVAAGREEAARAEARADAAEARARELDYQSRLRADRDTEQRRLASEAAARLRAGVGEAVERAAAAATELGAALSAAAAALGPPGPAAHAPPPLVTAPGPGVGAAGTPTTRAAVRGPTVARAPSLRRESDPAAPGRTGSRLRPVALPPAVLADSAEAAAHLVRVPGIHLVVDGYNVALTSWPEPGAGPGAVADLAAVRQRLLDALSEMVIRTKTDVTVVFDGADRGNRVSAARPVRPWLRIVFSASSVEADELILEEAARLRPLGPVAVATDDREVREGATRLGANVISVQQLMTVLNRHTPL